MAPLLHFPFRPPGRVIADDSSFELVTDRDALARAVKAALRERVVALDTEANGYHRYPERVCLVQLATPKRTYVIDPIEIDDMSALGPLLESRRVEKVIHGADYDIRGIDRDWGFRLANIFDSSIAARLAGMDRIGLAAALEECLGIHVEKLKRLQRADWSRRPLSDEALAYAAEDVAHMLPLRNALLERLKGLGRAAWAAEEFARLEDIRYTPPDPPEVAYFSFKGSRDLDDQGRAILRELALAREAEALRRGVPTFRIMRTEDLVGIAAAPDDEETAGKLLKRSHPGFANRLRRALSKGKKAPPEQRPRSVAASPRMTPEQQTRLKDLKEWRNARAAELALDVSVIWPAVSLDRLAREPERLDEEFGAPEVRRWQAKHSGRSLAEVLAKKREEAGPKRGRRGR